METTTQKAKYVKLNYDIWSGFYWKALKKNTSIKSVYKLFKKVLYTPAYVDISMKRGSVVLDGKIAEKITLFEHSIWVQYNDEELWIIKSNEYRWIINYRNHNSGESFLIAGTGVIGIKELSYDEL